LYSIPTDKELYCKKCIGDKIHNRDEWVATTHVPEEIVLISSEEQIDIYVEYRAYPFRFSPGLSVKLKCVKCGSYQYRPLYDWQIEVKELTM